MRSRGALKSQATSLPLLRAVAICELLMPGAAQRSSTAWPATGATREPTICEASS